MGKRLYVGNLPFSTDEETVHNLFSQSGQVDECKLIIDRATGRSKGFAFVEMSTEHEARAAIASFQGYKLEGRPLVVNEAKPLEPKSGGRR